jgi:hypothetical protein
MPVPFDRIHPNAFLQGDGREFGFIFGSIFIFIVMVMVIWILQTRLLMRRLNQEGKTKSDDKVSKEN